MTTEENALRNLLIQNISGKWIREELSKQLARFNYLEENLNESNRGEYVRIRGQVNYLVKKLIFEERCLEKIQKNIYLD